MAYVPAVVILQGRLTKYRRHGERRGVTRRRIDLYVREERSPHVQYVLTVHFPRGK